jgi:hypothetical protein
MVHGGKCSRGSNGRRQRSRRVRAADLKNGGPRYPASHTGRQFEKSSFLNEQSWNVIENKGSLWKISRRAEMFMKTQVLSP